MIAIAFAALILTLGGTPAEAQNAWKYVQNEPAPMSPAHAIQQATEALRRARNEIQPISGEH